MTVVWLQQHTSGQVIRSPFAYEDCRKVITMKETHRKYDAIIVGGGHNGLVAASYLAKAGKSVLLLEAHGELGGATTSVKPFPDYNARLSRYSYLVSLLPDRIVADLGIRFKTLERPVASYTPYHRDGRDDGLLVASVWDDATASSFRRLTGSDREGKVWREFYGEIAVLAERLAPSMLKPLRSAAALKSEIGLPDVWRNLMEVPIGQVVRDRFSDDWVRGVVLTMHLSERSSRQTTCRPTAVSSIT